MKPSTREGRKLHLLAWETTQACTLACPHCRANAACISATNELTTLEGKKLLKDASYIGPSIVILSGGEPLLRNDLEELAETGSLLGHTMVVACNDGNLLTSQRIKALSSAQVKRFSFSIHHDSEEQHDAFTAKKGAYCAALAAFERLKEQNIPFQINTTVLPTNRERLAEMQRHFIQLGAAAWHLFFIVPTGRAGASDNLREADPAVIEETLRWVADAADASPIPMKVTCAPQYARIRAQMGKKPAQHGRSCMAGDGFAFVGSTGEVKPCGYFDISVGNIRQTSFDELYSNSPEFKLLRNPEKLEENCGICSFSRICGGCRARAFAVKGNFMGKDPNCNYSPS